MRAQRRDTHQKRGQTFGVYGRTVRIDVRMQRARADPVSVSSTGDQAELFAVSQRRPRSTHSPGPQGDQRRRRPQLRVPRFLKPRKPQSFTPKGPHAFECSTRLAPKICSSAASREPDNPMIQTALAAAWTRARLRRACGRAPREKAFDASGDLAANRDSTSKAACMALSESGRTPSRCIERSGVTSRTTSSTDCSSRRRKRRRARRRMRVEDRSKHCAGCARRRTRIRASISSRRRRQARSGNFPTNSQPPNRRFDVQSGAVPVISSRARDCSKGAAYFHQGQLRPAETSLEIARQTFVEIGDRAGVASALNSLGSVMSDLHDIPRSVGIT